MNKYKISVISPSPAVCVGLETILEKERDFIAIRIPNIREASNNYTKFMELVDEYKPDIIVANVLLESWVNNELIRFMSQNISLPILVYSECKYYSYAESCLQAGAKGYVLMSEPEGKIVEAVRNVLEGGTYISEGIVKVDRIIDRIAPIISSLTKREGEVFYLIGQGISNREIATSLRIAVGTLKIHCRNITSKLNMVDIPRMREFAIQYAIEKARSTK